MSINCHCIFNFALVGSKTSHKNSNLAYVTLGLAKLIIEKNFQGSRIFLTIFAYNSHCQSASLEPSEKKWMVSQHSRVIINLCSYHSCDFSSFLGKSGDVRCYRLLSNFEKKSRIFVVIRYHKHFVKFNCNLSFISQVARKKRTSRSHFSWGSENHRRT